VLVALLLEQSDLAAVLALLLLVAVTKPKKPPTCASIVTLVFAACASAIPAIATVPHTARAGDNPDGLRSQDSPSVRFPCRADPNTAPRRRRDDLARRR